MSLKLSLRLKVQFVHLNNFILDTRIVNRQGLTALAVFCFAYHGAGAPFLCSYRGVSPSHILTCAKCASTDCSVLRTHAILHNIRISWSWRSIFMLISWHAPKSVSRMGKRASTDCCVLRTSTILPGIRISWCFAPFLCSYRGMSLSHENTYAQAQVVS